MGYVFTGTENEHIVALQATAAGAGAGAVDKYRCVCCFQGRRLRCVCCELVHLCGVTFEKLVEFYLVEVVPSHL